MRREVRRRKKANVKREENSEERWTEVKKERRCKMGRTVEMVNGNEYYIVEEERETCA